MGARALPFMLAALAFFPTAGLSQEIDGLAKVVAGEPLGKDVATGLSVYRDPLSNVKDYGMLLASTPLPVRDGKYSLRIELHKGDCGKSADWDDCYHSNERVELTTPEKSWIKPNSRTQYGWSIYLPVDWNPKDLSQIVMGQFHQADSHPAFQFFYQSQGGGLQVKRRVDETRNSVGTDVRTVIDEKELRGRWHDIRVEAYWRKTQDGYFKVFVNDALAYDFKGKTMSGNRVFFKLGVYRIGPPMDAPNLVVFYDKIWRK
ncbi:heparin lyase I family protein [Mesorhizobium sp. KR1-2]|uniref:heparin lyase I family protein n=1 Tax=Mesorhizobium sp. KR1-2 TaxID=3156609 RepID=UPI0032B35C64